MVLAAGELHRRLTRQAWLVRVPDGTPEPLRMAAHLRALEDITDEQSEAYFARLREALADTAPAGVLCLCGGGPAVVRARLLQLAARAAHGLGPVDLDRGSGPRGGQAIARTAQEYLLAAEAVCEDALRVLGRRVAWRQGPRTREGPAPCACLRATRPRPPAWAFFSMECHLVLSQMATLFELLYIQLRRELTDPGTCPAPRRRTEARIVAAERRFAERAQRWPVSVVSPGVLARQLTELVGIHLRIACLGNTLPADPGELCRCAAWATDTAGRLAERIIQGTGGPVATPPLLAGIFAAWILELRQTRLGTPHQTHALILLGCAVNRASASSMDSAQLAQLHVQVRGGALGALSGFLALRRPSSA
ncbi:hypothetical protein, variant 1 [Fonticula alba]|uniref:Uncharacterized protein n=1 Tax=Fonticula alba TaxID=691883 RepID=A0A058Z557_FONAL|nr:hypothetical protein, variant 1 [Fonticula alba]KCV69048.1 hypothetical protein, variant 1 [Fonticula alba]|eukprot:XP_009496619.1 hypothetical protein, variant 1 [Fonticula alba]